MVYMNSPSFGDKSSKGAYEVAILTSSYSHIGFREIIIGSTHTFLTHTIMNDIIFPYFGPNVYAHPFLRICSYALEVNSSLFLIAKRKRTQRTA